MISRTLKFKYTLVQLLRVPKNNRKIFRILWIQVEIETNGKCDWNGIKGRREKLQTY